MKNRCSSLARHGSVITLLILQVTPVTTFARGSCYGTAPSTSDPIGMNSLFAPVLKNSGYKVVRIQSDSLLGQRWAIIANCSHPEWPEFALPANRKTSIDQTRATFPDSNDDGEAVFIIRAGDIVRLWRQENLLRIEIPGVSEQNGRLGNTIRVRLLYRSPDEPSLREHLAGVVRGPSNVEIQR